VIGAAIAHGSDQETETEWATSVSIKLAFPQLTDVNKIETGHRVSNRSAAPRGADGIIKPSLGFGDELSPT
jgi:hypothetical protein